MLYVIQGTGKSLKQGAVIVVGEELLFNFDDEPVLWVIEGENLSVRKP